MTETLRDRLECPCCGDDGAEANERGEFNDGQALACGCAGWVSVGTVGAYICISDDACQPTARCQIRETKGRQP